MMVIRSSPTIQNKNKTLTLRIGILLSNSMDVSTTWNTSSDLRAWGEEMYLSIRTNPKHDQLKKQTQLGWQRNGIKLLCYSSRSVKHWNQRKVSDRKRNSYIVILTARILLLQVEHVNYKLQQLNIATVTNCNSKNCNS